MFNNDCDNEEDDSNGWLTSYADMMTLLACFFILMMAFANYDPAGFSSKARIVAKSFKKDYKSSDTKLTFVTEEISRHPKLKKLLKISLKETELLVTFSSSLLFADGKGQLNKEMLPTLDTFIEIVRSQAQNYRIMVEGHSSINEVRQVKNINSWELSSLRAAKVAKRFEFFGFHPKKIVAIGKADSAPIYEEISVKGEIDKDAARQNQTVLIRVLEPKKELKKVKFGFGIFFDE